MRAAAWVSAGAFARSSGSPGSSVRKNQFPPQATSPVTRPRPGTSTGTSRAWQKAATFSIVTAPSASSSAPTVPTGVSIRTAPGARRPRNSSVRTTPIRPCPHIPRAPVLLKKRTPAAEPGSTGGVSSAPTTASCPRGSQTTARRRASWRSSRKPRRSAIVQPSGCGQPATTVRVGSPSVCESTTSTRSGQASIGNYTLSGMTYGARYSRVSSLSASASPTNLSVFPSNFSCRPTR